MSKPNIPNAISSNEKSAYWILVGIGSVFILFSVPFLFQFPAELRKGEYGILFVLLFPLIGFGVSFAGWKMRQKFLRFGLTPLVPSPLTGQIGGQIGGTIHFPKTLDKHSLNVTLNCVHTYTSGSGDNSSTHHNILWHNQSKPYIKPGAYGSDLLFCFDVPAGERPSGKHPRKGKVSWQIIVEGMIGYEEFKRTWDLTAESGNQTCALKIPTAHKEKVHKELRQHAEQSADQQIQSEVTADGIDLLSDQGRNKSMSYFGILFGLIFGGTGIGLFIGAMNGEMMLWLMAPVFSAVGFGILGVGIFLAGRKLECKVIDNTVHIRRSLFGRILYTRSGKLSSKDQLELKETMSSQQGTKKTTYYAIYANVMDQNKVRKKLKMVEGIEGKMAAEAIQRKVEEALSSNLNDELGI